MYTECEVSFTPVALVSYPDPRSQLWTVGLMRFHIGLDEFWNAHDQLWPGDPQLFDQTVVLTTAAVEPRR